MSSELIPFGGRPARLDRQTSAAVRNAQLPAKRATARIQAAAIAAHSGLVCIEALSAVEAQVSVRQGALIDGRAKVVVDAFSGLVVTEITRLSLGGE